MQLVIHTPFGSRINRAWGLALRKRFCRKFNFELQAAATEDNLVLSLTSAHSFDLEDAARYLHSASVRGILVQALCAAPMFGVRWRWVAGVALGLAALPRRQESAAADRAHAGRGSSGGRISGSGGLRGKPRRANLKFPSIRSSPKRCAIAWKRRWTSRASSVCCARSRKRSIRVVARDLTEPSPLALEVLSARPYAYLDDAPLEERRTQAVMGRRWLDPRAPPTSGGWIRRRSRACATQAWPDAESPDELHDALTWMGYLTAPEVAANPLWEALMVELVAASRAVLVPHPRRSLWVAADRRTQFERRSAKRHWPPSCKAVWTA